MTLSAIALPARPKALRFDVRAVVDPVFAVDVDAGTASITIFDVIGGPNGVSANRVAAALRSIGARAVTVQINSPGGDAYEGATIFNLLRAHSEPVTVQILGMAASAASLVAMAGTRIEMARNSQMMIHNAHALAIGDSETMAGVAEVLALTDRGMAAVYSERTGLQADQIRAMMTAETFLPADEAIDLGFADALLARDAAPGLKMAAADAPQSKRDLETQLRTLGFAKSAAARVAAGGWPALASLTGDVDVDVDRVAARIEANIREFKKL